MLKKITLYDFNSAFINALLKIQIQQCVYKRTVENSNSTMRL